MKELHKMKKLTLTTIAILSAITLTACGNHTDKIETPKETISSSVIEKAHSLSSQEEELVEETYPQTSSSEVEETTTAPSQSFSNIPKDYFMVTRTCLVKAYTPTEAQLKQYQSKLQGVGGTGIYLSLPVVKDEENTTKAYQVVELQTNDKTEFVMFEYLTNGASDYVGNDFARYMMNLAPTGELKHGLTSNANHYLEQQLYNVWKQDID